MATYTLPRSPVDPETAALDLIVRLPIDLLDAEGLRPVLQDYSGVLHAEGVFAGMSWADAGRVATVVAFDVCLRCLRDDTADFLRDRARIVAAGTDDVAWHDRARVAQALDAAATVFEL
jgi:hypothetical protein